MHDSVGDNAAAQHLTFTNDKGASRSFWLARLLTGALVAWMGSGLVFPAGEDKVTADPKEILPVAVAVTPSKARMVTQFFQAEGQALPDRDTAIRSETSGQIAEVFVQKRPGRRSGHRDCPVRDGETRG